MSHSQLKVLTLIGNGPDAIRMAPIVNALTADSAFEPRVCITGWCSHMLEEVISLFGITPEIDLGLNHAGQDIAQTTSQLLHELGKFCNSWQPDIILVHGDSPSALAATLAAYCTETKVCVLEAGYPALDRPRHKSDTKYRQLIGSITDLHFAPSPEVRAWLQRQGVPETSIHVIGNTLNDANETLLQHLHNHPEVSTQCPVDFKRITPTQQLIVAACQNPEHFGRNFTNFCHAMVILAWPGDAHIVLPMDSRSTEYQHMIKILGETPNIQVVPPLDYLPQLYLMQRAGLIITDSPHLQEEATALGKPVLYMGDNSPLSGDIDSGAVHLVGGDPIAIIAKTNDFLDEPLRYASMTAWHNQKMPKGPSRRIMEVMKSQFS